MAPTVSHPDPKFSGRVANVDFANGKAETDNEGSLAYFRRHEGFKVGGKVTTKPEPAEPTEPTEPEELEDEDTEQDGDEPDLEAYTVPQLKDYAEEHEIDLGGATRKADILAAINKVQA